MNVPSVFITSIMAAATDFGGLPSAGVLRITKTHTARCILEITYATASGTDVRRYITSYRSEDGGINNWKVITAVDI